VPRSSFHLDVSCKEPVQPAGIHQEPGSRFALVRLRMVAVGAGGRGAPFVSDAERAIARL